MARGKDLKKRKCNNYSAAVKLRCTPEYIEKLKISISNGRVDEKKISDDTVLLSFDDTINQILALGKWTQGTNRKLYLNKSLLKSVLYYSRDFILSTKKISERIYGLLYGNISVCNCCKSLLKFSSITSGYTKGCSNLKCSNALPTGLAAVRLRLGDVKYETYLNTRIKPNSKDWFILKYKDDWQSYYDSYRNKMKNVALTNLQNLKTVNSSKSANSFFDELFNLGYSGRYFNNGGEVCIVLDDFDLLKKNMIFIDFMYDNKIIEYDGEYFHDKDEDSKRDTYLESLGFITLRISHKECCKERTAQISKCIEFLNS
jgi:hypothetical protein